MKWIPLSTRFPDDWEQKCIRPIDKTYGSFPIDNNKFSNQNNSLLCDKGWYPYEELEWLDESEVSAKQFTEQDMIDFANHVYTNYQYSIFSKTEYIWIKQAQIAAAKSWTECDQLPRYSGQEVLKEWLKIRIPTSIPEPNDLKDIKFH
jgi:hypothetical protein